jgi:hypothetical protein
MHEMFHTMYKLDQFFLRAQFPERVHFALDDNIDRNVVVAANVAADMTVDTVTSWST